MVLPGVSCGVCEACHNGVDQLCRSYDILGESCDNCPQDCGLCEGCFPDNTPGCDGCPCENCVCSAVPQCCSGNWGLVCVFFCFLCGGC